MRTITPAIVIALLVAGCQTSDAPLENTSDPGALSGPASGAIAGDMASRLVEHIGPPSKTTFAIRRDNAPFATALEAALIGWGYTVLTDSSSSTGANQISLTFALDSSEGKVLARLTTPSLTIARAYSTTAAGASPASPLSVLQRG